MCGITGIISLKSSLAEPDFLECRAMTAVLKHRGPDDQGFLSDQHCCFGNTRLNIIDLTAHGHLPMANDNKKIWLCYNGEVTNFLDLKKQFKLAEKYHFISSSDTEVVLRLYEELGLDFLKHLSGMFALAIYDQNKQKVYIVRDQYGMRPLFYMQTADRFYFASEIKSFLELSRLDRQIDRAALWHYFSLIYIPGAQTPFTQIKELDGGHYLDIDLRTQQVALKEYYQFDYTIDHGMTEQQAVSGLHDVLLDSMRRNLISDAPLGMTLSGGIDTSAMLGFAKKLGKSKDMHTFSIKMAESSFDESYYQRLMTEYAGSIHHEIVVSPEDVLESMYTQMAYLDEPNGNGAVIPSLLMAKEARKYVKALLSGEGGDELNNAYDTHLAYKVRKLYRKYTPQLLQRMFYAAAHGLPTSMEKLSFDFKAKRFTAGASMDIPGAHLYWRHVFTEDEKRKLLRPEYQQKMPTDQIFRDVFERAPYDDDLNKISLIDFKYFFIGDLMVKNDRTFMANSIEARFPFVDRIVVDFATKIPPHLRIKGFTPRYAQKQAVRSVIPKGIYQRSSMGLEMPHALWFFNGLSPLITKFLSKKELQKVEHIIDPQYVLKLWQEHQEKRKDNGRALWSVINLQIWHELFIETSNYKKFLH